MKGKPLSPGYIPGSHWANCERCDFTRRAEELKEEWNGLWVCADTCFETRHPQDFLRAKEEKIAADQPLNPSDTSNTVSVVLGNPSAVAGVAVAGYAKAQTPKPVPSGHNDGSL